VTSFLYGVVVFAGLGYMANKLNTSITSFIEEGSGLVYIVYPEIIATFKGAPIFAAIFFIMLITLGIDSAFGGMEGMYTAIVDEYPFLKKHWILCRFLISIIPFLTCLPTVTYGGMYVVHWLDTFSVSPSVLIVVFLEVVAVTWIYGLDKFCLNIKEMNMKIPHFNWRYSWKYICPISLLAIIICTIVLQLSGTLQLGQYKYPVWSTALGMIMNFIALLPIPCYAVYVFINKKLFKKEII
jgi:SNF family Na+-dependent transporter